MGCDPLPVSSDHELFARVELIRPPLDIAFLASCRIRDDDVIVVEGGRVQ